MNAIFFIVTLAAFSALAIWLLLGLCSVVSRQEVIDQLPPYHPAHRLGSGKAVLRCLVWPFDDHDRMKSDPEGWRPDIRSQP